MSVRELILHFNVLPSLEIFMGCEGKDPYSHPFFAPECCSMHYLFLSFSPHSQTARERERERDRYIHICIYIYYIFQCLVMYAWFFKTRHFSCQFSCE